MLIRSGGDTGGQVCLNAPIARSVSRACAWRGNQVTSMPWDAQGEALAALRAIVADPRYGPPALSNAQTMTNLLKDMLPDAPRESRVLVAASEAGVAGRPQSSVSEGGLVSAGCRLATGTCDSESTLRP